MPRPENINHPGGESLIRIMVGRHISATVVSTSGGWLIYIIMQIGVVGA
jgi:hypothetical protein